MWFEKLTGFREENGEQVRSLISVEGGRMVSSANGREMGCGHLQIPSLAELRKQVEPIAASGQVTLREVVADVQELHKDPTNAHAFFQVASQFNLLEMPASHVTPDAGIDGYEDDHTQGPACAIACGAGTIYRNYFVPVGDHIGQSSRHQIDCLADLGEALCNRDERLWEMRNGYALATQEGLAEISQFLSAADEETRDQAASLLRIGVQRDVEVTLTTSRHSVTQAYCSAVPISYSQHSTDEWAPFAKLVLDASYEATFCAAILNAAKTGQNRVFLTLIGGGVFGNRTDWILQAIKRAVTKVPKYDLDVAIVSYGRSQPAVSEFCSR